MLAMFRAGHSHLKLRIVEYERTIRWKRIMREIRRRTRVVGAFPSRGQGIGFKIRIFDSNAFGDDNWTFLGWLELF
jgi:hypothetical protein